MMEVFINAIKRADSKIEDLMRHGMTAAKAEAIVFNGDELTQEQADLIYAHMSLYKDTTDGYVIDRDIREAEVLNIDTVYLRDKSGSIENMALLMDKGYKHIVPTTLRVYTTSKRFYEVIAIRMERA